jgi:hypothetical protein
MERLDYDSAIKKSMTNSLIRGKVFQIIIVMCAVTSIMTGFVILGGISFLEKIPNKFECKDDSLEVIILRNENMTHSATNSEIISFGDWKPCS